MKKPDDTPARKHNPLTLTHFPTPPINFDPHTASRRELAHFGYPHRPDPDVSPELHRTWMLAFSRPLRHVEPRFVLGRRGPRPSAPPSAGGTTYAGYLSIDAGPVQQIWGSWTVPTVSVPSSANPNSNFAVLEWVGITDASGNSVLGGTHITITPVEFQDNPLPPLVQYWAVAGWNPAMDSSIAGLPVAAGDTMWCYVYLVTNGNLQIANYSLCNFTQGFISNFSENFDGVDGVQLPILAGVGAWVVENPEDPATTTPTLLPNFSPITFTDCGAKTLNMPTTPGLPPTVLVNMFDSSSKPIAQTKPLTTGSFQVDFVSPE